MKKTARRMGPVIYKHFPSRRRLNRRIIYLHFTQEIVNNIHLNNN